MIKQELTYEDFDGNEVTESFHFHLSKSKIIELEAEYGEEGFEASLLKVVEAKDNPTILSEFKKILLMAYGVRSEDGKRFEQSPELSASFSQSPAYDELFVKMLQDAEFAGEFINGLVPRNVARAVAEHRAQQMDAVDVEAVETMPPPAPPSSEGV